MSRISTYVRQHALGLVAIFIALGGSAYATHTHRMGTQDLQNRTVTAPKVANGAVIPRTLRNHAVRPAKIATDAIRPRHIDDGAVGTDELAGLAVTTGELGNLAVTGAKLGSQSVSSAKLGNNAVTAPKIATNAVGARQLAVTVRQNTFQIQNDQHGSHVVTCQSGEQVLGGGGFFGGTFSDAQALGTHFVYSGMVGTSSWGVRAYNGSGSTRNLTIRVICANPG